jgi:hypothetical protein
MTITTNPVSNTTADIIYTSVGNTVITSLTMCNWGPGNVTANLYVVPNSSAPDTTNIALSNIAIPASETAQMYMFSEKLLLGPGDAIYANSSDTTVTSITSYTNL